MNKEFAKEHRAKRNYTTQGMWFLIVFFLLLLSILGRFAIRRHSNGSYFSGTPSGSDAFQVAKDFLTPTLPAPNVDYPKDDYRSDKESDSIYVVKSWFQLPNNGTKTNFVVKLKYLGGDNLNDHSWELVYIREE